MLGGHRREGQPAVLKVAVQGIEARLSLAQTTSPVPGNSNSRPTTRDKGSAGSSSFSIKYQSR